MSMIGHVLQITHEQLQRFQADPKSVRRFLHGKVRANVGDMQAALARVQKLGQQAQASGAINDPAERARTRMQILQELRSTGVKLPGQEPNTEGLSLEKSWHSLHYLLTGVAGEAPPPLGNAILGGASIGDDGGYGPARFLTPERVREVAEALSSFKIEQLEQRFDVDAMSAANIYACPEEEELEMVQHYFKRLVQYYSDAAAKGKAMLLWID
jgi:hypothetical protein